MKNVEISHEEEDRVDSSHLDRLPDEILFQILTKLTDLKTLCFCHLVSKRLSSLVLQIDTISFIAPLINPTNTNNTPSINAPNNLFRSLINGVVFKPLHLLRRIAVPSTKPLPPIISSFYGESFRSAVTFLSRFKGVKSLCIELPSSRHRGFDNDSCLFNWKVKFGHKIESFLFLSPNSINKTKETQINEEEEEMELSTDSFKQKVHIAFQCLKDVIMRHRMLLYFVKDLPMLENVSITDSGKRGKLYLSGKKLMEEREWIQLGFDTVKPQLNRIEVPVRVSQCYVPLLELPVSGFVMKGVTFVAMEMNSLQSGNDGFVNGENGFEDNKEFAYSEAVMEIMENHKEKMKRLL